MKLEMVAKFEGRTAEEHYLPAYAATQSLYGIARSNLIILNYLAEGKVRRRNFGFDGYDLRLVTQRPGSYESVFDLILNREIILAAGGTLAGGVAGNLLTDFLKGIYHRAIGDKSSDRLDELAAAEAVPAGDILALVEAVTPALKSAHQVIGSGANTINLTVNGSHNIVHLNQKTKDFMNEFKIDNTLQTKEFSIGSFNANSGEGRAYDYEAGYLVTFDLANDIDKKSIELITDSISKYAMRKFEDSNSRVAARYTCLRSLDGSVKKMRFIQVRKSIADLDASSYKNPN